jgi:uncharacterized protein YaaQ
MIYNIGNLPKSFAQKDSEVINMKIVYAIVSSDDGNRVTDVLNEHQFVVTKLATTGGFLKKGNSTLMIGTEDSQVDEVIKLIKDACGKRQKINCNVPAPNLGSVSSGYMMMPMSVELGGATIFVTDVERFEKI